MICKPILETAGHRSDDRGLGGAFSRARLYSQSASLARRELSIKSAFKISWLRAPQPLSARNSVQ